MPLPPLPYPYSDWDQRPVKHAPWQRGCDLYEAYGRFLERIENGTLCEDDGGWCDFHSGSSFKGFGRETAFVSPLGNTQDSGSYDSHFGYTTEEECESHRLKELSKLKRATKVNAGAKSAVKKRHQKASAGKVWREDVVSLLRKRGPQTFKDIFNTLGPPPNIVSESGIHAALQAMAARGRLRKSRRGKVVRYSVEKPE